MERSELLDVVRGPLSPDMQVEVPASREEYERVQEMLENEQVRYEFCKSAFITSADSKPEDTRKLWYDGTKHVAIVVAAPSPLHSRMASELINKINEEVKCSQGMDDAIADGLSLDCGTTSTKLSTTRAWDSALLYTEDDDETLMIAVEVGFSQTYESLRAAISWCVCALRCRLGIAMSIHEEKRRCRAKEAFRRQIVDCPFGPLVWNGMSWMGKISSVEIQTFRAPEEETYIPETLLNPTQSFVHSLSDGQFVGGDVPSNLHEIVLGDCIPSPHS
ncbi:hypothetical protein V1508DRAFT_457419 [Lipomyces doorenjongii]|uniref:uncharacterized protein n=1 Tax=Lipomyces doorenjongii TaxID=383834 RepID=UPI0034CFB415